MHVVTVIYEATGELLVWPDFKGVQTTLCWYFSGPASECHRVHHSHTGEIETLQIAIDAAVRAASPVPAMSERMLRLPLTKGGLGVHDVTSRVASWLRILNGDTVAATVLQCEMYSCREMHLLRSHNFPEKVTRLIQQIRNWMQSENGRLAAIDICLDGGVCHRTRKVTGGFAIVCTDCEGDTCRRAAGWRIGSFMGHETAPPQESSVPELVACQSAVRHILDGERADDTHGDMFVLRDQANFEDIPVSAWLDNKSVVDVVRQSLCPKSLHHNPTNMGRIRELAADLRHNNTQIEWTKGHTENTL